MKKSKNKYNHYTEDFRREAVRRSDDPNTSAAEIAKELGIHPGQIYNWRRQYKRLSEKQFNSNELFHFWRANGHSHNGICICTYCVLSHLCALFLVLRFYL